MSAISRKIFNLMSHFAVVRFGTYIEDSFVFSQDIVLTVELENFSNSIKLLPLSYMLPVGKTPFD